MKIKDLLNQVSIAFDEITNAAIEKLNDPNVSDETKAQLKDLLLKFNKLGNKEKD